MSAPTFQRVLASLLGPSSASVSSSLGPHAARRAAGPLASRAFSGQGGGARRGGGGGGAGGAPGARQLSGPRVAVLIFLLAGLYFVLTARNPPDTTSLARRALSRGFAASGADTGSGSVSPEQLKGARDALKELIRSKHCNPILIRLGWHDSGTYNKDAAGEWPKAGGAIASIRFKPEIDHGANAGLVNALALVEPIKERFPRVSYADLFQMASATAVEVAGGPAIPMRYGRVDATGPHQCSAEGNLPAADPPNPAEHLRKVFYRMGLNDKEIVALSGAHTLGRARPDRSGFGKKETKYTKDGPGNPGGSSWTPDWLTFDNSYFVEVKAQKDQELLVLPTDAVLFQDPEFKKYADKYAEDQGVFFADYAAAHKKLSELGSKFDPPQGITID